MLTVNISEAKAQLSALIEKVLSGEDVIIGKAGKPVAKLIRYEPVRIQRKPGALRGKIHIAEDFNEEGNAMFEELKSLYSKRYYT